MVSVRIAVALVAALFAPPQTALAHPIHMSVTQVRIDSKANTLDLVVKVFADDFSTAAARYTRSRIDSGKVIDGERGFAYLRSRMRLASRTAIIPLRPCGVTQSGQTLLFCLRARVSADSKSLRLSNQLMMDLFNDQVNVVQSAEGRRRSSRIFVRGDGSKPLI